MWLGGHHTGDSGSMTSSPLSWRLQPHRCPSILVLRLISTVSGDMPGTYGTGRWPTCLGSPTASSASFKLCLQGSLILLLVCSIFCSCLSWCSISYATSISYALVSTRFCPHIGALLSLTGWERLIMPSEGFCVDSSPLLSFSPPFMRSAWP